MTLTNQELASRCQKALDAYSDHDTYTSLVDFLSDAMHLCHLNGHSFVDALYTAQGHFDAEIAEDDGEEGVAYREAIAAIDEANGRAS